jgi:hypothetical protein
MHNFVVLVVLLAPLCLAASIVDITEADLASDKICTGFVNKKSGKSHVSSKSFGMTIQKGFFECSKAAVALATPVLAVEYKDVFEAEQRQVTNELASLKNAIESSLPLKTVSPAFQWAQSTTELLLNVKFSHKIDAPATLNVQAHNVNITENKLLLEASDGRKLFRLEIDFHGNVLPEESSWSMASVGRMTFNIKKKESPSRWTSLTKGNKKLPQMHMWWDAQEKHAAALAKLEEDEDTAKVKAPATPPAAASSTAAVEPTAENGNKEPLVGGDDAGRIISEEELARRAEAKRMEDEHRKKVSDLEDDARKRKKEIDAQAKEQKSIIDGEVAVKKAELETIASLDKEKFGLKSEL